jgi:hypothetical protein
MCDPTDRSGKCELGSRLGLGLLGTRTTADRWCRKWCTDTASECSLGDAVGLVVGESAGGAHGDELVGDVGLVEAGPVEEAAGVVGEGCEGAFASVAHGGEPCGSSVDDGG